MAPNPSPATLRDLVTGLAQAGDRPALMAVDGDRATTLAYAPLADRALRLATGMARAGIKPGDPVLLFGPNSIDWIVVRLALGALGTVAVALDELSSDGEVATLVPDSGAGVAFLATGHVERARAAPGGDRIALYRLDGPEAEGSTPHYGCLIAPTPGSLPAIRPDDPMMLVYTSGTTGTPKGFYLTHANVLHNVGAIVAQRVLKPDDRALLPLPLHHVYPQTVGLFSVLATGALLVLPEAVSGPEIVRALKIGRVSAMIAVPRLYAAMVSGLEGRVRAKGRLAWRLFRALQALALAAKRRFGWNLGRLLFGALHRQLAPDLWLMVSGGARFEADLIWRLEALGWDVRSGWGLAETSSILTNQQGGPAKRIGGEGPPLAGMALRVAMPDETGVGELECRGPSLFQGYRNDPVATQAAFTADGWFRTGDRGFLDDAGRVYITGRAKEMIVLGGGKNIYPEELEKVYAASPFFAEMAVLEENGALVALVVPDMAVIGGSGNLRIDDVVRVALAERAQGLPSFQRLAGYAISREPLPRTRLGKYQRFRLADIYRQARAGLTPVRSAPLGEADRALLAGSPAAELWQWLGERYPGKQLHPDLSPQLDLGIDSLEWVGMTMEMAERFDIHFTEEDAAGILSLRDLLRLGGQRRAAAPPVEGGPGAPRERGPIDTLTPDEARWLAPAGAGHRRLGRVLMGCNRRLVRWLFQLRVEGLENLPRSGPLVIACNHLSDIDPAVVAAAIDADRLQRVWWGAEASRLFTTGAGRALARAGRVFPVQEKRPAASLAFAATVLAQGDMLVWFPESWRSPDGRLQRFFPGVGHLVHQTGARVVPARITGTFEAMPRGRRVPRLVPVKIAFGPALEADALAEQGTGATPAERIVDALHTAVASLAEV